MGKTKHKGYIVAAFLLAVGVTGCGVEPSHQGTRKGFTGTSPRQRLLYAAERRFGVPLYQRF